MMILKTVFAFEWKKTLASPAFWMASVLLLCISLFALNNGKNIIREQENNIKNAVEKESIVFKEIVDQMQNPDTSTAEKKWQFGKFTDPSWTLISPNKRWTSYWKPSPSGFLSVGNRDVYPYYHEMEPFSFYMRFFKSEISSPFKLLFGNFDLAFVIVLLFPLLIIAFSFDSHSAEVENGTYPMINAVSNAAKVVNFKFLFYLALALLLLKIIMLLSIPFFNVFAFKEWLLFTLIANIYILIWFGIAYVIIRLKKSSVQNAIILLTVWIFLTIGIPAISNAVANAKYPVNAEIFSKHIRRVQLNPEPAILKNRIAEFVKLYPEYEGTDTTNYLLFGKAYAASGELNDRQGDKALAMYFQQIQERERFLTISNFLNPVTRCQQLLNQLTETDLQNYISYVRNVRAYVQVVKEGLLKKYFSGQEMTIQDFQKRLSFDEYLINNKN